MGNLQGALLMVISMAGFAVEDMFIKLAAQTLPIGEILIMLGVGGAAFFAGLSAIKGEPILTANMLRGATAWRTFFEIFAGLGFVSALAFVPISVVTTIIQVNPLLVTLGAALVFKEAVGWRRWTAITFGLIGVLIVLRPFGEGFMLASLFAVLGVVSQTGRDLATRRITHNISSLQISTLAFLAGIPAGLIVFAVGGATPVWPSGPAWAYMMGALGIGIPALYAIIAAMRVGDISFVAPFRYTRLIFGLLVGVIAFGETIDFYALLGAAIITGSGLYSFIRETQLRRRASLSQPATV